MPLAHTDDTQMVLLLLEHVAAAAGHVEPQGHVALLAERGEAWRGCGAGMQRLVQRWRAGAAWQEAATPVFPDGSFGNGAAMRVAPLGAVRAAADATHVERGADAVPVRYLSAVEGGRALIARAEQLAGEIRG